MKAPSFQQFWDAYGLKRDRYAAERIWNRMSATDRREAFNEISAYRSDCQQRGISMMYGQGYLSHRRWEDEPSETPFPAPSQHKLVQQKAPSVPVEGIGMEMW